MICRREILKSAGRGAVALLAAKAGAIPLGVAAQDTSGVRLVSRERLLRESAVARRLQAAEQQMTEMLQGQIDRTKQALADEEAELSRLRAELSYAEFQIRIEDFDGRMRMARQLTQERVAALERGFQEARAAVVAAIPGVMEQLRIEAGASVIVNADQAMAADPALDLTDRAVELFDRIGPSPPIPQIDLTLPVADLVSPGGQSGGGATE